MIRAAVLFVVIAWLGAATSAFAADPLAAGKKLFLQNCSKCHGTDGAGAPGSYPRLHGPVRPYFRTDAGRAYVSQLVLTGMTGRIKSGGESYYGAMPSFADLSNEDLAKILNFVSAGLNGPADGAQPIAASQIQSARKTSTETSTKFLRAKALQAGG